MKPIIPGCLALIIMGKYTGKTVRCISGHKNGDSIECPDGVSRNYLPKTSKHETGWLIIGDVMAVIKGQALKHGFGIIQESRLMRIDAEGDDELIDEFNDENAAHQMEGNPTPALRRLMQRKYKVKRIP